MASIIIPATKSLTVTDKFPDTGINAKTIKVGYDNEYTYFSYLFFDISVIPYNAKVLNAELVLFKTDNFYDDSSIDFSIYQLSDYFSTVTTFNNRPAVIKQMEKNFYPMTSKAAVTVDLTDFISLWIKGKLSVTGIILSGKDNNCYAKFGSSVCQEKYLIPFIKVNITPCDYNENCSKQYNNNCRQSFYQNFYQCCSNCYPEKSTIKHVHVTGTVAPESKYVAVIEAEVTRNDTGKKDNYYVTDEYDNSLMNKPLLIDKTYNIVINPKESEDDIENINFYGSYKR